MKIIEPLLFILCLFPGAAFAGAVAEIRDADSFAQAAALQHHQVMLQLGSGNSRVPLPYRTIFEALAPALNLQRPEPSQLQVSDPVNTVSLTNPAQVNLVECVAPATSPIGSPPPYTRDASFTLNVDVNKSLAPSAPSQEQIAPAPPLPQYEPVPGVLESIRLEDQFNRVLQGRQFSELTDPDEYLSLAIPAVELALSLKPFDRVTYDRNDPRTHDYFRQRSQLNQWVHESFVRLIDIANLAYSNHELSDLFMGKTISGGSYRALDFLNPDYLKYLTAPDAVKLLKFLARNGARYTKTAATIYSADLVQMTGEDGSTALEDAATYKQLDVFKFLVDRSAAKGVFSSVTHAAAKSGFIEGLSYLKDRFSKTLDKAKIPFSQALKQKDDAGKMAVDYAIESGNGALLQFILQSQRDEIRVNKKPQVEVMSEYLFQVLSRVLKTGKVDLLKSFLQGVLAHENGAHELHRLSLVGSNLEGLYHALFAHRLRYSEPNFLEAVKLLQTYLSQNPRLQVAGLRNPFQSLVYTSNFEKKPAPLRPADLEVIKMFLDKKYGNPDLKDIPTGLTPLEYSASVGDEGLHQVLLNHVTQAQGYSLAELQKAHPQTTGYAVYKGASPAGAKMVSEMTQASGNIAAWLDYTYSVEKKQALNDEDRAFLEQVIEKHPNHINALDGNALNPLARAAKQGDVPTARLLLQRGAGPTLVQGDKSVWPAKLAYDGKNPEMVKLFSEATTTIAPILNLLAASGDRLASVRKILTENPYLVHSVLGGDSPLMIAEQNKDFILVDLLLSFQADPVEIRGKNDVFENSTGAIKAARERILSGHNQLIPKLEAVLLNSSLPAEKRKTTPEQREELRQFLSKNRSTILERRLVDGFTPLMIAVEAKDYPLGNLLLELNANPYAVTKTSHSAFELARTGLSSIEGLDFFLTGFFKYAPGQILSKAQLDSVEGLLKTHPWAVNQVLSNGLTPYMMAVELGDSAFMNLLQRKGADTRASVIRDGKSVSALSIAQRVGSRELVDLVKSSQGDFWDSFESHYLVNKQPMSPANLRLYKFLTVKYPGAVIYVDPRSGMSLLHLAAQAGDVPMVELLVRRGALNRRSRDGFYPADLARQRGFRDLARYLDRVF